MAYIVYLDSVALPVTPSKIQMKIKNQNKTINLINDGEVNILKDAGLTDINFKVMIPLVKYPFAIYIGGFKEASFYLDKFEKLKVGKSPFQFIVSRTLPDSKFLFDTNLKVSLEDYGIDEDASDGQSLMVNVQLKQWKDYGTKKIIIEKKNDNVVASVKKTRTTGKAPKLKTYTVAKGDTLWAICKKHLGNGQKYPQVAKLNGIKNPNLIYPGQVIRFE